MAKKIRDHGAVDADFLAAVKSAPHARQFIPYPRNIVWNALLDKDAWTEWLPITKVDWTSPKPYGVGTTRTVEIGSNIVDETFIIWEEGRRMAFRFDRSGFPVKAGVEDYHIVDVPGGCELQWTCRMEPILPQGFMLNTQMRLGFRLMLRRLKKLIDRDAERFGHISGDE